MHPLRRLRHRRALARLRRDFNKVLQSFIDNPYDPSTFAEDCARRDADRYRREQREASFDPDPPK